MLIYVVKLCLHTGRSTAGTQVSCRQFLYYFIVFRRTRSFTLFPYTTLFRSPPYPPSPPPVATTRWQGTTTGIGFDRSEEHTSELQSRLHLVCRLLLEKKNATSGSIYPLLPSTALSPTGSIG